jgi:hypothetical protein
MLAGTKFWHGWLALVAPSRTLVLKAIILKTKKPVGELPLPVLRITALPLTCRRAAPGQR